MLSQDELSAKTGGDVTSGTIKRIEQAKEGAASAYLSTVRRLAEALGVPPASLTLPPSDIQPVHDVPPNLKAAAAKVIVDVDRPAREKAKGKRGE